MSQRRLYGAQSGSSSNKFAALFDAADIAVPRTLTESARPAAMVAKDKAYLAAGAPVSSSFPPRILFFYRVKIAFKK